MFSRTTSHWAIFAALITPAATNAEIFIPLGDLPGGNFESRAFDISADGEHVVGQSHSGSGDRAFLWDLENGMQSLGELPGGIQSSQAMAVSGQGSVVAGISQTGVSPGTAFIWDSGAGIQAIPSGDPDTHLISGDAISVDGTIVVGDLRAIDEFARRAYIWDSIGGVQELGDLSGTDAENSANDVSSDGSVVVGTATVTTSPLDFEAFVWDAANGMQGLGGTERSQAAAVSGDGEVVGGRRELSAGNWEGILWYPETGNVVGLDGLPGGSIDGVTALSGDGAVAGGYQDTPAGYVAMIWDADHGSRTLESILEARGVDTTNWTFTSIGGISADGSRAVGVAKNPSGQTEGFIVALSGFLAPDVPALGFVWLVALGSALLGAAGRASRGLSPSRRTHRKPSG